MVVGGVSYSTANLPLFRYQMFENTRPGLASDINNPPTLLAHM